MRFMTMNEVADVLAVNRMTVHRLIKSGQLKAVKVNSAVRIPEESFQEFVERNKKNTAKEVSDPEFSTARSLLKFAGTWVGGKEDAEKVLEYIIANRADYTVLPDTQITKMSLRKVDAKSC